MSPYCKRGETVLLWPSGDLPGPGRSPDPALARAELHSSLLSPSGSPRTSPSRICPPPPRAPSAPRHRAPWLSVQEETGPLCRSSNGLGGHVPRPLPTSPHCFRAWDGAAGLPYLHNEVTVLHLEGDVLHSITVLHQVLTHLCPEQEQSQP